MSPVQQMIVAVLTSSAVTGAVIEIVRAISNWISRKKSLGYAKLEKDVSAINDSTKKLAAMTSELESGTRVILHHLIWAAYRDLQDEETISIEDKSNLDYMYNEYKRLNGNHRAEIMYEEISKKEVRKE